MKRLTLFCLLLVLLTGCAHTSNASSPSVFPEAPGKADVENFYAAAAQVYDWFDLTTLPLDETDSRTENGQTYYRVDCQSYPLPTLHTSSPADSTATYAATPVTLSTLADLQSLVESYFSPELAASLFSLSPDHYRDFDGVLYAQSADRGSNLYLLDKTVSAAQQDADHWTVTLTFWAQYEDSQLAPVPDTQETWSASTATVGYSQSVLDLERTADGWRFTSFCSSDDLDLDAETVFTFCYGPDAFADDEPAMDTWSDYKLGCWLLHADALSEGAATLLTQRFLDDPESWFSALAPLAESPLENAQIVVEGPAYDVYAWFSTEEQARFEEILDTFQPRDAVQQTILEDLKAARERAIKLATDNATASFCLVTDGTFLSLGEKEGAYPWGNPGFPDSLEPAGAGDNGDSIYTFSFQGVEVTYSAVPDTGNCYVFRMFTDAPGPETLGGIQVGSTVEELLGIYPSAQPYDGLQPSRPVSFDRVYVWEPGGLAYCKHIAFFLKDGIVAAIKIEDLMDGRLLS